MENIIVVIKINKKTLWYRGKKEIFILDYNKCNEYLVEYRKDIPQISGDIRNNICVVDSDICIRDYLNFINKYEIDRDFLSFNLAKRYSSAESWWDVSDLFPIMFIDFDLKHLSAFYPPFFPQAIPIEKFIPSGWLGEFKDFATESGPGTLAKEEKFWVKGDADLLLLLNERAIKNKQDHSGG